MEMNYRTRKFVSDALRCTRDKKNIPNDEVSKSDFTDEVKCMFLFRSRIIRFNFDILNSDSKVLPDNITTDAIGIYYDFHSRMKKCIPYSGMNIFDKLCTTFLHAEAMNLDEIGIDEKMGIWVPYFETVSKGEFNPEVKEDWCNLQTYSDKFFTAYELMGKELENAKSIQNVLEMFEKTCKSVERIYRFSDIVETFKIRMGGQDDCLSCLKCLPLFDVLYSISYGRNAKVNDFQLVEGYIQLFLRIPSKKDFSDIWNNICESSNLQQYLINKFEQKNYFDVQCVADLNKILYNNIFEGKKWDSSTIAKKNVNCKRCVFCGEDKNEFNELLINEDDSKKIRSMKSFISKKVSNIKGTDTKGTYLNNTRKHERERKKRKEKINLRLFLTLGVKSEICQVKNNIEKELKFRFVKVEE